MEKWTPPDEIVASDGDQFGNTWIEAPLKFPFEDFDVPHAEYLLATPERKAAGELLEALREIADQDGTEIALDPYWPKRIARAALAKAQSGGEDGQ